MIISDGRKIKVYNGTGSTISANKVIIIEGKRATLASNTDVNVTKYPLGYTLSSINSGEYGEVLLEGSIQNINSSSYGSQGTILYLNTNGNITAIRPSTAIIVGTTMTNDLVTGSIYFKTILDNKVPYTGATNDVDLGEYELKAGQIEFDQTPTGATGVAVMRWNDADGTVDLGLKGGAVTLQIGQELVTRIVNKTDSDLLEANYQAVRVSGAQGNRLKVDLAQANNDANSAETLGIVTETILKNAEGFITTSGLVRNIDTTGTLQGETWLDGNMLYLSGTIAGQLTNVKPSAPTHTVIMGYVVRAHATQGQIYVKVDNGYELDELHNVRIVDPIADQTLIYDADNNLWTNADIPAAPDPVIKTVNGNSIIGAGNEIVFNSDRAKYGYEYFNDFLLTLVASGASDATGLVSFFSGTGASLVVNPVPSVRAANQQGFIQFNTGTVITGYAGVYGTTVSNNFLMLGGGAMTFITSVFIPTLSTSVERFRVTIGYGTTSTNVTETNGVFFTYDEGGTQNGTTASPYWQCVTVAGGVRTLITTTVLATTTAWQKLTIQINDAATSVEFYIDNVLVATHSSNIPSGTSQLATPKLQIVKTVGTTSRAYYADYIGYRQTYTTAKL